MSVPPAASGGVSGISGNNNKDNNKGNNEDSNNTKSVPSAASGVVLDTSALNKSFPAAAISVGSVGG
eukprot:CAMPEP_0198201666 /NCGR_PEP_ID=MMETSP1445-20131203/4623_1 /TAXON_ID=36898 /ORGANISM="Pyramimonas sp., Strain CCMP2087" /LENGTH=66 /DNA_ID=CAMNT_0043872187 /DNA_START=69 /DNA_END=265 /DNA_ORIENTATION=+